MENNTITENTDIVKDIYKYLDNSLAQIEDLRKQEDALIKKINSNVYSQDYVRSDLIPKRDEVTAQIRQATEHAIINAENMVSQYKAVADRLDTLDPEMITSDIKLLQPNIMLEAKDVIDILERNKDNRTMLQITLRYAKAKGIDLNGFDQKYWRPNEGEILAKSLNERIHYVGKWIKTPMAKEMLDKFFGM